jgi:hypothetical protein
MYLQLHSVEYEAKRRRPQFHPHDEEDLNSEEKRKVLLVSIVPPRNDCGVRIVMHRHLVTRNPFELHVVSNADSVDGPLVHTPLRLPYLIHRLRKSRFGPRLTRWITDYPDLLMKAFPPYQASMSAGSFWCRRTR